MVSYKRLVAGHGRPWGTTYVALFQNPSVMGNVLPKWDLRLLMRAPVRWMREWDPDLDRLEDFASHFGEGYGKYVDAGFFALGSAAAALLALTFG